MSTFKATIKESSKELTGKQKAQVKDYSSFNKLDAICEFDPVLIDVDFYAVVNVENPRAKERPNYDVYVVADKNGSKFYTSSESFYNALVSCMEDMAGSDEEWQLKVFKRDSKNYSGKKFITCCIV